MSKNLTRTPTRNERRPSLDPYVYFYVSKPGGKWLRGPLPLPSPGALSMAARMYRLATGMDSRNDFPCASKQAKPDASVQPVP